MKLFLLKRKDEGVGYWDVTVAEVIAADNTEEALSFSSIDGEIIIDDIGEAYPKVEKGLIVDDYKKG